ncbi:MAG: endonuclease domain-containing protein [Alistipes sp.]|nr:endonuclease domain-containing protein [Alistipes sp.]
MEHPQKERLLQIRKELRKNLTPAEATLWSQIKARNIKGYKWRRQHPVGPYILDFYCPEVRLCIELDGAGHYTFNGAKEDLIRTAFLNEKGIRVLRFENRLIWENIDGVIDIIARELESNNKYNLEY